MLVYLHTKQSYRTNLESQSHVELRDGHQALGQKTGWHAEQKLLYQISEYH